MRHSGNVATVIDQTYGGEGATVKLYVHDELGRFVTVASLSFSRTELEALQTGVMRRRIELDNPTLFEPEPDDGRANVRWLPPQP